MVRLIITVNDVFSAAIFFKLKLLPIYPSVSFIALLSVSLDKERGETCTFTAC